MSTVDSPQAGLFDPHHFPYPWSMHTTDKNSQGEYLCPWFTGSAKGYRALLRWMHLNSPKGNTILLTENGFCGGTNLQSAAGLHYYQVCRACRA